jgi:hypothetical protein
MMKWYFGLDAAGVEGDTGLHARLAVLSALSVGGLEPHCLYAGERDDFTAWMEAHGVVVHPIFPRFAQVIRDRAAEGGYSLNFMGHWLRSQICLIEHESPLVLYTDCDIVFRRTVAFGTTPPQTIACAPEFDQTDWSYFNSGVMLMNLDRLRQDYDAFEEFAIAGIRSDYSWTFRDQRAYNEFYKNRWSRLDPLCNWKPYWGYSPDASILHFHGPKFHYIRAVADGFDWTADPVDRQLGSLLLGHLPAYLDYLRLCEKLARREDKALGATVTATVSALAAFAKHADLSQVDLEFTRPVA